jgi:hypothetical protein
MCPVVTIFIQFSPNYSKWQLKKNIFEIKVAYVKNDTSKTGVKITYITTLHYVKW